MVGSGLGGGWWKSWWVSGWVLVVGVGGGCG